MSRGRQSTVEQDRKMAELVWEGFGPTAIRRELERLGLLKDPHPTLHQSTIDKRVRELKGRDESGPWSLAEADPEDAALVVDVLSDTYRRTKGRVWLTQDLASWLVRVRRAAPSIPPLWAYALARGYQSASTRGWQTRGLDITIGAAPWMSAGNASDWVLSIIEMDEQECGWPDGGGGLFDLVAHLPPPPWAADQWGGGAEMWHLLRKDAVVSDDDDQSGPTHLNSGGSPSRMKVGD